MRVLYTAYSVLFTGWTGTQFLTGNTPPALDAAVLAATGVVMAYTAVSPPTEEKSPVTRVATPEIEPDVKGTFYCQAGDHIVDHVIWLESITLGCRPCMEKLGKEISSGDWMPRLWSVTKDGAKLAKPIPKPVTSYVNPYQHHVQEVSAEAVEWFCQGCKKRLPGTAGTFNTNAGFRCKDCTVGGVRKLGQDKATPLQKQNARDRERRAKIVERQSDQIERANTITGFGVFGDVIDSTFESINNIMGIPPAQIDRELGPLYDPRDVFAKLDEFDRRLRQEALENKAVEEARRELAQDFQLNYQERPWPAHREAQLSTITQLTMAKSTDVRPAKGKVGQFVYVHDLDQLFTWMHETGWVQVGMMNKPPVDEPVDPSPDPDPFVLQRKKRLADQRGTFTDQTCTSAGYSHRYKHGDRLCKVCGQAGG